MKELSLEKMEEINGSGVCAYASIGLVLATAAIPGLNFAAAAVSLTCAAYEISQEDWWKY